MSGSKANLVIVRDDDATDNALAVAALDEKLNQDAAGAIKSTFDPVADRPYFWVHLDAALEIVEVRCSSGSVRALGLVTRRTEFDCSVDADGDTLDLAYNPEALPVFTWYGNVPSVRLEGRTLTFSGAVPAAGSGDYAFVCHSYQYIPPPLAEGRTWRVRIVVHVRRRT